MPPARWSTCEEPCERIVECEVPIGDQQQERHGRELFAHRGETIVCGSCGRGRTLYVGQPKCGGKLNDTILEHHGAYARHGPDVGRKKLIKRYGGHWVLPSAYLPCPLYYFLWSH